MSDNPTRSAELKAQTIDRLLPPAREISMPHDGTCRTRALNVLAAMSYVRAQGGRKVLAGVLERLREEDIQKLSEAEGGLAALHATRWVPFALHCRLLRAIDAELGDGDLALLHDVGQHMARRDIPRVFRSLMKVGRPGWIFDLSTRMWRYYHDRGTWHLDRTPVSLIATLRDHAEADEAFCETFLGWMNAALALGGATDLDYGHPACRSRGAPHCVYTVRWT